MSLTLYIKHTHTHTHMRSPLNVHLLFLKYLITPLYNNNYTILFLSEFIKYTSLLHTTHVLLLYTLTHSHTNAVLLVNVYNLHQRIYNIYKRRARLLSNLQNNNMFFFADASTVRLKVKTRRVKRVGGCVANIHNMRNI